MRVDRFNGGTMRRYYLRTGILVCVSEPAKRCSWIPAIIPHISVDVSRACAAELLRAEARARRKAS